MTRSRLTVALKNLKLRAWALWALVRLPCTRDGERRFCDDLIARLERTRTDLIMARGLRIPSAAKGNAQAIADVEGADRAIADVQTNLERMRRLREQYA